jgi:hypothetical protein
LSFSETLRQAAEPLLGDGLPGGGLATLANPIIGLTLLLFWSILLAHNS